MNKTGDDKFDSTTEVVEEVAEIQQRTEQAAQTDQQHRENLIAEVYEKIGQIRAADTIGKFANVSSLMWLKQVKETKSYKDIPMIGSWEKLCETIGISRAKVDQDILNLNTFGEEFLANVSSMNVGYRELRKLRQLKSDGTLAIESGLVKIGDEEIPLNPDHAEDLQDAIETVLKQRDKQIDDQKALVSSKERIIAAQNQTIHNQERDLQRLEKDLKERGFAAGEEAFLNTIDRLRGNFAGIESHLNIDNVREFLGADGTPRMIASYLELIGHIRRISLTLYDRAIETFGDPKIDGTGWTPPYERTGAED